MVQELVVNHKLLSLLSRGLNSLSRLFDFSHVNALLKVVGFSPGTPVSSHRESWLGGLG